MNLTQIIASFHILVCIRYLLIQPKSFLFQENIQ